MSTVYDEFEPSAKTRASREYNPAREIRHRSSRTVRRTMFFGLSALWGFIAGVAGLLAGISIAGEDYHAGAGVVLVLVPSAIVAIFGGFVIAAAYRESKRRARD